MIIERIDRDMLGDSVSLAFIRSRDRIEHAEENILKMVKFLCQEGELSLEVLSDSEEIDADKFYLTADYKIYNMMLGFVPKLALILYSEDDHNGHINNLNRYIEANKITSLKDLRFTKTNFRTFLKKYFGADHENNVKNDSSYNFPNKLLSFISLRVKKVKISSKITLLSLSRSYIFLNKLKVGLGYYNFFLDKPASWKSKFERVSAALSDETSRRIYHLVVYGTPHQLWLEYFDRLFCNEQYQDFISIDSDSTIINLGVANGFELPFFISKNPARIVCVDPCGDAYLSPYVRQFVDQFQRCVFVEKYLYSNEFCIDQGWGVTSLSELIKDYSIEGKIIIKSDIEGLECELVRELKQIITAIRPQLAISIYHIDSKVDPSFDQLQSIPNAIIQMTEDYDYFVRHYTYNRRETIFYAIPKEITR